MNQKLFLMLFLWSSISLAQFSKYELQVIDSLNEIVNNKKSADTSLAHSYYALSGMYGRVNLDTIITLCSNTVKIVEKNNSKNLSEKTRKSFDMSLSKALHNMAYVYSVKGEMVKSLEFYERSKVIKLRLNDKVGLGSYYGSIGFIYKRQGDIPKALENYHLALQIHRESGKKRREADVLNNIGLLHKGQGDTTLALKYYYESLKIGKSIKDWKGVATSLNNIGILYKLQKKNDEALSHYRESLVIRRQYGNQKDIANSLNNIGALYESIGETDSALMYFKNSLKLREESQIKIGITASLNNIGSCELQLGNNNSAEQYLKRGLKIAYEIGSPRWISENSYNLKKLFIIQKKYKKALEMYELHVQMRDSINNEKTQKATIRQQTKYEFERAQLIAEQKRNEELRVTNAELQRRDNLQYSIILVAILAVFGLVLSLGFVSVSPKVAEGLIFFAFLILFEFLLVLTDPYVDSITGGEPMYKLLLNAVLAGLIFPAHSYFERILKKRLLKN